MRDPSLRRSGKEGLSPGTLVHIGQPKAGPIRLHQIEYDASHVEERALGSPADCRLPVADGQVLWLDVGGIHQLSLIEQLGTVFHLHPLMLEDIVNTEQRPKADIYENCLFLVFKTLRVAEDGESVRVEQVSLVLGSQFVLSFEEDGSALFGPIVNRLNNPKGRLRNNGADYLAYALLDMIVDHYFSVLETFGERIEGLEQEVVIKPTPATLRAIHTMKRELLFVRRAVWPVREMVGLMQRGETDLIHETTKLYLRDVSDHTVQVIDTLETFREMTTGMLDVYLSSISHRLNSVMKVLTIIATIFMPLTFIAGIYGMNFDYMPELRWHWGYPAVVLLMLAIGLGMLWLFKRKGWLS
jgi:magnesium transporter